MHSSLNFMGSVNFNILEQHNSILYTAEEDTFNVKEMSEILRRCKSTWDKQFNKHVS